MNFITRLRIRWINARYKIHRVSMRMQFRRERMTCKCFGHRPSGGIRLRVFDGDRRIVLKSHDECQRCGAYLYPLGYIQRLNPKFIL